MNFALRLERDDVHRPCAGPGPLQMVRSGGARRTTSADLPLFTTTNS
jgi:hypothetical protein